MDNIFIPKITNHGKSESVCLIIPMDRYVIHITIDNSLGAFGMLKRSSLSIFDTLTDGNITPVGFADHAIYGIDADKIQKAIEFVKGLI